MRNVERVARAICAAEKMNPDEALGGWRHWTTAADAAIAAVREDLEFKIGRLDLRARDILVVKIASPLPTEIRTRIRDYVEKSSGGHQVMVLDGGADLAVLTAANSEENAA